MRRLFQGCIVGMGALFSCCFRFFVALSWQEGLTFTGFCEGYGVCRGIFFLGVVWGGKMRYWIIILF